ncbi:hypothetical protein CRE_29142 [Caenorhabditis remanei]|uniref:Uncharacterized protein n=1 Tax=Caenorhabditis remanei TaxID=31234 RepID=E3N4K9_CAERE|nr:hypothetical protein CRE_29142 [Caenorhabditis remanei]
MFGTSQEIWNHTNPRSPHRRRPRSSRSHPRRGGQRSDDESNGDNKIEASGGDDAPRIKSIRQTHRTQGDIEDQIARESLMFSSYPNRQLTGLSSSGPSSSPLKRKKKKNDLSTRDVHVFKRI